MKISEQMQQAKKVATMISTLMATRKALVPRVRAEIKAMRGRKRPGTLKSIAKAGPIQPAARAWSRMLSSCSESRSKLVIG